MIEQFLDEIPLPRVLSLPAVGGDVRQNEKPEEVFLEEGDKQHRLTNFIRAQYLDYVGKVLKENYQRWLETDTGNFSGLVVSP